LCLWCYTIIVKRESQLSRWHRVPHDARGSIPLTDESEKKLKNLLTNFNRCAIIKAQRARERQPAERADPRESVRPLLQDPYRTVSLCAVYKCEPTPRAEKMLGLRRVHKPKSPSSGVPLNRGWSGQGQKRSWLLEQTIVEQKR
jgi:hypothetical protein